MAHKSQNMILSALIGSLIPFSQMTISSPSITPPQPVQKVEITSPTPVVTSVPNSVIWVVKPGETAKSIAKDYYGHEEFWTTLWNDNPWITNPSSLPENASVTLRKEPQITPEELHSENALQLRNPRTLTDGERYVYLMTHPFYYGGLTWSMPILTYKYISTPFSYGHPGIDMTSYYNTPVYAATDGMVVEAGWSQIGYGQTIVLSHSNGYFTRYAHLSSIKVSLGQYVSRGALIAAAGCTGHCTGVHLHFEVHEGGNPINPLDVIHPW
jgi:murein DD-endopeptidase MepM/ murein hydrolase activator NlpD